MSVTTGSSGLRALRATVLGAALLLAAPAPPCAAAADPYQAVTLALGQGLVALFPAAEGYVVSVNGAEVFVDLAGKDLMRPGMELQIYRPGQQMVHPVSKEVLGTYEQTVGYLAVAEVRDKYSRGLLRDATAAVAAGDRVRVSAGRLRALLHFSGKAAGVEFGPLAQALIGRGEQSGRFQMIDEPKWAPALAALGVTLEAALADPGALKSLGSRVPADALLLVRLEERDGRGAVVLSVRSLRTGATLEELREPWPAVVSPEPAPVAGGTPAAAPPATAATAAPAPPPPAASPAPGEYTTRTLANPALYLAAGDFLGEGRLELVLSDGYGLALYRWEDTGLVWKWDEGGSPARRVLDLQAGDVDGDGRPDLVVTTVSRGSVRTEVRSWRDGKLAPVAGFDSLYLRVALQPGGRSAVYGQRAGVGEAFSGRVEEYRWKNGALERVEGTALPRQVGIFGLAFPAPGAQGARVLALDRDGYLKSFTPEGRMLWRSGRQYGGAALKVGAEELFGGVLPDPTLMEEEGRAFQPRIFTEDLPDGALRVFVPRNFTASGIVMPRQRYLGQGEIVVLEGSPTDLEETRRTHPFDGYVADSALADADGDGARDVLFLVVRRTGYFLGEEGKLVLWRPFARGGK
jgi:hypothetical protein